MIKIYTKENDKEVEIEDLSKINNKYAIVLDDTNSVINTSITDKKNNKVDLVNVEFNNEEDIQAFVSDILIPHILDNQNLIFIAVGDSVKTYEKIEEKIDKELRDLDLLDEDIEYLMPNISIISVLSKVDTSNLKANSISFIDVNNNSIKTEPTEEYKKALEDSKKNILSGTYGNDNGVLVIHNGTGKNSFKEYTSNKEFLLTLNYCLDNKRIKIEELINIIKNSNEKDIPYITEYKEEEKISKDMPNAPHTQAKYKDSIEIIKEKDKMIEQLIYNIERYSSPTTYKQILMASGIIKYDEKTLNATSDKRIREFYNQIMSNSDESKKNNTK